MTPPESLEPSLLSQIVVAVPLVGSALIALVAALGQLRLADTMRRSHAVALLAAVGIVQAVLAATAAMLLFPQMTMSPVALVVMLLLILGSPIPGVILARAVLYRARSAGRDG